MATRGIARRDFVAGGALAGVAAIGTASGVAGAKETSQADQKGSTQVEPKYVAETPEKWDRECEVLVVGTGIGGCTGAIEAHDLGADVLVVTAAPDITECSCTRSGGWLCGCCTKMQADEGIEDSVDLFIKDVNRCGDEMGDPDVIRAWAEESGPTVDWLIDEIKAPVDGKVADSAAEAGGSCHSVPRDFITYPIGNGLGWMQALKDHIEQEGIEVMLDTPVKKLYRDESGRVTGALAEPKDGSGAFTVHATKGIIFNPGGLGGNVDAWCKYTPVMKEIRDQARKIVSVAPVDVKADGYQMLEDIDAYMYPAPPNYGGGGVYLGDDEPASGTLLPFLWADEGSIWVNLDGKRYANETSFDDFYGETKKFRDQPGMCTLVILDNDELERNGGQTYVQPLLDKVRQKGIENSIYSADTLEELADKAGITDKQAFLDTVQAYNDRVDQGGDEPDEFGRTAFENKIQTPPFYAVEENVCIATSKGGTKIDAQGRVIDNDGNVIPGICAVGEIAFFQLLGDAHIHVVGGCNSPSACFGRIAARTLVNG